MRRAAATLVIMNAFIGSAVAAPEQQTRKMKGWEVKTITSKLDDTRLVVAAKRSKGYPFVLNLACGRGDVSANIQVTDAAPWGHDDIKLLYRVDRNQPIQTVWRATGGSVTAKDKAGAQEVIRSLVGAKVLLFRIGTHEGELELDGFDEVVKSLQAECPPS